MKRKIYLTCVLVSAFCSINAQSHSSSTFNAIKEIMIDHYSKMAETACNDSIQWRRIACKVSIDTIHNQPCINANVTYIVHKYGSEYAFHSKNWWFDKDNNRYAWLSDIRVNEPYGAMPCTFLTSGGYSWQDADNSDIVLEVFNSIK